MADKIPRAGAGPFECGYNLVMHGSLLNDMDLIAIPWAENVKNPSILINALGDKVGVPAWKDSVTIEAKPHGRTAYTIPCGGDGAYLDVSVLSYKS